MAVGPVWCRAAGSPGHFCVRGMCDAEPVTTELRPAVSRVARAHFSTDDQGESPPRPTSD